MNLVELLREKTIEGLFKAPTFQRCWGKWSPQLRDIGGTPPTPNGVKNIGNRLAEIFATTGESGRPQGALSGGGYAWEALICWYLNLLLIGTRTVIVKNKAQIAAQVSDALTVTHGSTPTNTESDLIAITYPDQEEFSIAVNSGSPLHAGYFQGGRFRLEFANNDLIEKNFSNTEVAVIQCKTNWNDNAQVPMLWDMVYASSGFPNRHIKVGQNGWSLSGLKRFAYAFVTMPSNKDEYKTSSLAVLRVYNLSGGNFWGQPTQKGIALNIFEIVQRNFESTIRGLDGGWQSHSAKQLKRLGDLYPYFRY